MAQPSLIQNQNVFERNFFSDLLKKRNLKYFGALWVIFMIFLFIYQLYPRINIMQIIPSQITSETRKQYEIDSDSSTCKKVSSTPQKSSTYKDYFHENTQKDFSTVNYVDGLLHHKEKIAHFENVCYKKSTGKFFFFTTPHQEYLGARNLYQFSPEEFRLSEYYAPRRYLPLQTSDGPILDPKKGRTSKNVFFLPEKLAILLVMYGPHNYGHVIMNDLYSSYLQTTLFKLDDKMPESTVFLNFQGTCKSHSLNDPERTDFCNKLVHNWLKPFSSKPIILENDDIFSKFEYVCFENLLVGQNLLSYHLPFRNLGWGRSLWDFRDIILRHHQLDPSHRPTKQKVIVSAKAGRRVILNQKEVVTHIRTMFPNIEIEEVAFPDLTSKQQLQKTLSSTFLISPAGGISFISMFCPVDSSVLFWNSWILKGNEYSASTDEFYWRNVPWLNEFEFRTQRKEVTIRMPDGSTKKSGTFDEFYYYGDLQVNLARLTKMAFYALYEVEKKYGWTKQCMEVNRNNDKNGLYSNGICFEKEIALKYMSQNKDSWEKKAAESENVIRWWPAHFDNLQDY